MWRFDPETCCVECGSRKEVVKNVMFFKFGEGPKIILGDAFVNQHHFRPTGQVWLRSHGWSFIYADEIKKSAVKYNGLAFGSHKNQQLTSVLAVVCLPEIEVSCSSPLSVTLLWHIFFCRCTHRSNDPSVDIFGIEHSQRLVHYSSTLYVHTLHAENYS